MSDVCPPKVTPVPMRGADFIIIALSGLGWWLLEPMVGSPTPCAALDAPAMAHAYEVVAIQGTRDEFGPSRLEDAGPGDRVARHWLDRKTRDPVAYPALLARKRYQLIVPRDRPPRRDERPIKRQALRERCAGIRAIS